MPRPLRSGLPLVVWAVGACALAVLLTVGGVALGLRLAGALDVRAAAALAAGGLLGLAVAVGTARTGRRFAAALRQLRAQALARLTEPGALGASSEQPDPGLREERGRNSASGDPVPRAPACVELVELSRTLDALQLRVRVADEVAERSRRTAQTTSAGMFELLSGLVAAEEGARGQLAAELHDTVAQTLTAARSRLASTDLSTADLRLVADLVAEAEEQVRAVMARTRPPALRDGDLAAAVEALRDDLRLRYALRVTLDWPPETYPLPFVTAVTLYRFFQEALLNVVKHADVDDATASLAVEGDDVVAVVADAGAGFDPRGVRALKGRHVGLGLLRERARLAGGTLEVRSRPQVGTTLRLRLPRTASVRPTLRLLGRPA